jgi:hypothetical protein
MAHEEHFQKLADKLNNDPGLMEEFRESPVEVIERHVTELTEVQQGKVEGGNWSDVSDEEIVERLTPPAHMAWL